MDDKYEDDAVDPQANLNRNPDVYTDEEERDRGEAEPAPLADPEDVAGYVPDDDDDDDDEEDDYDDEDEDDLALVDEDDYDDEEEDNE